MNGFYFFIFFPVYVPISSDTFQRTLTINIQTLNRQYNASVRAPQWKIHVTMLECPTNFFPKKKWFGGSAVRFFNNDANIVGKLRELICKKIYVISKESWGKSY
jgi:hypothetical protein